MTAAVWTSSADVKAHVGKLWQTGRLLASVVHTDDRFPLRVPLRRPTTAEWASRFDEARTWVAEVRSVPRVRVEWRRINHRQLGLNEVPWQLWVDTVDDAAALIGRRDELRQFRSIVATTTVAHEHLLPVLAKRPLDVLDAAPEWAALLGVVDWIVAHPSSGLYVRQLDVPGVHTKTIERHSKLLAIMIEHATSDLEPPTASSFASSFESSGDSSGDSPGYSADAPIEPGGVVGRTGVGRPGDFARRFGFRPRPRLVRFRSLDPSWRLTTFDRDGDYTLTATDFARIPPPERVFITENEVNFLAFPSATGAIVVFGSGSGLEHLGSADWLATVPVRYWGDIDTHGFWILDQLRAVVPDATSMLMDRATLMAHEPFWGIETKRMLRNLNRLTSDEQSLYDDLRDQRIRPDLRLEQERIRFSHVRRALTGETGATSSPRSASDPPLP